MKNATLAGARARLSDFPPPLTFPIALAIAQ
jgi:hypothetical protein